MYSTSVTIHADNATVWRYLTVPELMREWIKSIDGLRTSDGGPLELGSTLLFEARGSERTSSVTEFEENQTVALQSVQGPFEAVYRYRLAPRVNGCLATLEVDCSGRGFAKLFAPIIKRLAWWTDRGQLDAVKEIVESARHRSG